jgi:hypothetical protein
MPKRSLHRANGTKAANRLKPGRHRLRMMAATKKQPLVPERVLQKLAELKLPPNPWVYQVCLRELLAESAGIQVRRSGLPRSAMTGAAPAAT